MTKTDLDNPELLINRELSWLEFNDRVLREGLSSEVHLLERLKFLAIVSSNLEEFFMVRVAGLMQQRSARLRRRDASGMTPVQQLKAISERVRRMVAEQSEGIRAALAALAEQGLLVLAADQWTPPQRRYLRKLFEEEILPVLTPMAVEELDPPPLLPGGRLNIAVLLACGQEDADAQPRIVVVPVPQQFPRFLTLPGEQGVLLTRIEDVMVANATRLLPGCKSLAACVFRITRDADVPLGDDDAGDLLASVEQAVRQRRRRAAVRMELSAGADGRLKKWLIESNQLLPADVYEVDTMLDASALMEIATRSGFEHLKDADWPPQPPADLIGREEDLYAAVRDHDVLLIHPYESFEPVIAFLEQAAADPQVLAIKQTLYRTSGESPIIRALEQAAVAGKEVTVLVELKARFDEARNVNWARRLEDAGCHVIYGVAGFKTHAKCLLIVRREERRIASYVHLSTGNYNDKTARLYSDFGLMTADPDIAADVAAFFNLLTGYSEAVGWTKFTIAPTGLRQRFEDLIEREIQTQSRDEPGLIMAKLNSLEDAGICRALYRASQAGVKVLLNVRGICCLRPGLAGVSETIEVRSIIDRYLEHARVFYFRNGGHEELYMSSADWMTRNLDRRLEVMYPVTDGRLKRRLTGILRTYFHDNVKSRRLRPDGTYERYTQGRQKLRAQQHLHDQAVAAARDAQAVATQFRPLSRPEE